jgi:O-antigen/teichoic acid export membrane protein
LIGIVTLPIFTRLFDPSAFGVIEGVAAIASMLALFSTLMLESSAQRSYYDHRENEAHKRRIVISTALWALIVWNIVFFLPILPNYNRIANVMFDEGKHGYLLLIALIAIPITSLYRFLKEIFRLHNQPGKYTIYTAASAVSISASMIVFVVVLRIGLVGYFWGGLIGGLIVLPPLVWSVRKNIVSTVSWPELKKMLHYGLPLIPTNCSIWVLTLSDRFFLLRLTSLKEVGLYAIGVKLTQLLLLFITAFGLAWSPFILSIYSRDKEEEKRVRGKITTYYLFVLALLAVFITVFSKPLIFLLTTREFLDAHRVIGILALATAASGASQALCTGINIARKTKYLAWYTFLAALLNILLNATLIPKFGMMGAAVATAVSYYFLCFLYYRKSQQLYFSPYELDRIIKIAILSGGVILAATFINGNALFWDLLAKTLLFLSFVLLCLLFRVFDSQELHVFRKKLQEALGLRGIVQ